MINPNPKLIFASLVVHHNTGLARHRLPSLGVCNFQFLVPILGWVVEVHNLRFNANDVDHVESETELHRGKSESESLKTSPFLREFFSGTPYCFGIHPLHVLLYSV